jgi:mRNA-degrading endonuclease toxin of MazEF toxin-antitoxin module
VAKALDSDYEAMRLRVESMLTRYVGCLSPEKLLELDTALAVALGLK